MIPFPLAPLLSYSSAVQSMKRSTGNNNPTNSKTPAGANYSQNAAGTTSGNNFAFSWSKQAEDLGRIFDKNKKLGSTGGKRKSTTRNMNIGKEETSKPAFVWPPSSKKTATKLKAAKTPFKQSQMNATSSAHPFIPLEKAALAKEDGKTKSPSSVSPSSLSTSSAIPCCEGANSGKIESQNKSPFGKINVATVEKGENDIPKPIFAASNPCNETVTKSTAAKEAPKPSETNPFAGKNRSVFQFGTGSQTAQWKFHFVPNNVHHSDKHTKSNSAKQYNGESEEERIPDAAILSPMVELHRLLNEVDELYHQKMDLPKDIQDVMGNNEMNTIITACEQYLENINTRAGKFLHKIEDHKCSEAMVETVAMLLPKALLHENDCGEIPIQSAAFFTSSLKFVPILAKATMKHHRNTDVNVNANNNGNGNGNGRANDYGKGGLLLEGKRENATAGMNIIEWLVQSTSQDDPFEYDEKCVAVLDELEEAGMLDDIDFSQFDLIGKASSSGATTNRLRYLLDLKPVLLSTPLRNSNLPIHNSIHSKNFQVFETALKAGMDHFSEKIGFLFAKDRNGNTALKLAIEAFGKDKVLKSVECYVAPSSNHPILHYVFSSTPELADDFVYRYPDAMFLTDKYGRSLLHVALQEGMKLSGNILMMIYGMKHVLKQIDPLTGLYPFMLASVALKSDLTTVNCILRRDPGVLDEWLEKPLQRSEEGWENVS